MKYFIFFLMIFSSCFAEGFENTLPFSDVERGLPTLIGDCVNVISGDYVESGLDLYFKGPNPLTFERFYSSSDYDTHSLFWGWRHNHDSSITYDKKKDMACYIEQSGRAGIYKNGRFCKEKSGKGFTNCGFGRISARNSLKNISLIKNKAGKARAISGAGVVKDFDYLDGENLLIKEKLPNGNQTQYYYNNEGFISRIVSGNKNTVFSELQLNKLETLLSFKSKLVVNSNDGRKVTYHLKKFRELTHREKKNGKEPLFHISQIESSDAPTIKYKYSPLSDSNHEHICKRALPDQRTRLINYYDEGEHKNKVKTVASPVGTDSKPVLTHFFKYEPGRTIVFDAHKQKTVYSFDDSKRLTGITRFLNGKPYSLEKFSWNDFGELLTHSLIDSNKTLRKSRILKYDDFGNILSDTNKGDQSYTKHYTYDKNHLLIHEKEENGLEIHYTYDDKQRLTFKEYVGIKTYSYAYNENSSLIEEIVEGDGIKLVTTITPTTVTPIGLPKVIEKKYLNHEQKEQLISKVINHYSPVGRILKEDHYDSNNTYRYSLSFEYDAHGNVISETNALGECVYKKYDVNDNLISEIWPTHQKSYTYDFSNRCIKETILFDDEILTTSYCYNTLNQRIASIDPSGNETRYTYDSLGRLTQTIYPDTETPDGELQRSVMKQEYDIFNNVILDTDQRGESTHRINNIEGNPLKIDYPDGTRESFIYNPDGSLKTTVAKNGKITTYIRDHLKRIVREEEDDSVKTYRYNAFHLISETDPEGITTYYEHDGAGHLISKSKEDNLVTYEYDPLGRLSKIVEADSVTIKEYDLLDRIVEERDEDLKGNVYKTIKFAYDSNGNKTHEIRFNGQTITEYNPLGKPLKITDPLGNITHFSYEYAPKKKVTKTEPSGHQVVTTYNALQQKCLIEKKDSFGNLLSKTDLFYDSLGNLSLQRNWIENAPIETAWKYNALNKLVSVTEASNSPNQVITTYRYNKEGQKEALIKPDGTVINYAYDGDGRLSLLTSSDNTIGYRYSYNRNGLLTKVDDLIHNTTTERTYNSLGKVTNEKLGNGLYLNRQFDSKGRVITTELPDGSSMSYAYNPSNLQKVTRFSPEGKERYHHEIYSDLNGNPFKKKLAGEAGLLSYSYDSLNRVVALTHDNLTQEIEYDLNGNINQRTVDNIQSKYNYDDLNQIIEEPFHTYQNDSLYNRRAKDDSPYEINDLHQVTHDGYTSFEYDRCGRLIRLNSPAQSMTLSYDALDQLIKVVNGSEVYTYVYDSFGRRLSKNDIQYLYDDKHEIGVYDPTSKQMIECRILEPSADFDHTITIETKNQVLAPLCDTVGSITALIDIANGKVVEKYAYTTFGEELTEGRKSSWRYLSKRVDPETGFVFFGKRYYNPHVGKWLTKDPAGFIDSTNLYQYVFNNPLRYIDPTGEIVFTIPVVWWGTKLAFAVITSDALFTAACTLATALVVNEGVKAYNCWERSYNRYYDDIYFDRINKPSKGKPNSSTAFDNGNGTGTIRVYGSEGNAETDYDLGHDHGAGDPHAHDWEWSEGGQGNRGKGRPLKEGE